jgi:hypothetical protein
MTHLERRGAFALACITAGIISKARCLALPAVVLAHPLHFPSRGGLVAAAGVALRDLGNGG